MTLRRRSQTLHDIAVELKHSTQKAHLFNDGAQDFWVPKSICADDGIVQLEENKDGSYTLTAPEWWLIDRELI